MKGYFAANNTAYMVMEYAEGEPLDELLDRRGKLTGAVGAGAAGGGRSAAAYAEVAMALQPPKSSHQCANVDARVEGGWTR